ncbi:Similar to Putative nuclease HARBI1; acc. no. Q8BR93 [Pyronema omphalodes CBS 100304]|uniref:Similar to Putative nuclease HARBI1 acc. no. Q8BR93 n=1 Tax=Pyronema omphalodes (strain CBS 100304) TaxID=1076935 RepID=U4LU23_PYROM|nr:Similar to Putative nuclease HARBI1; acc. no. Q8BR93 [Pyronema omphalodes CBS 100304]
MDRENFERLLELIVDHEVFKNRSPVAAAQQTHPRYQLAVFLLRMGGGSKSGSMTLVLAATAAGVGEGSIVNISRRVPIAILSLHDTFTHWPTREEKAVLKQCYAPLENWWYYFSRKSTYALNAMVVYSDQRKILYVKASDNSASHDARIFDGFLLHQRHQDFFEHGEYLIGDSAYTATDRMVSLYKQPYPSAAHAVFNSTLCAQRIAIEHTFGILKARFPSITNMSIRIQGHESHKACVDWFIGACILHNFLRDVDDRE